MVPIWVRLETPAGPAVPQMKDTLQVLFVLWVRLTTHAHQKSPLSRHLKKNDSLGRMYTAGKHIWIVRFVRPLALRGRSSSLKETQLRLKSLRGMDWLTYRLRLTAMERAPYTVFLGLRR